MSRDGNNIAVACPNKKCASLKKGMKKLSIRLDTDQSHCWVCGLKTHDSLVPILRLVTSTSEVQEYLRKYAVSSTSRRKALLSGDANEDPCIMLPQGFRPLALLQDSREPYAKLALNYLKGRGLTGRDLWYYKIGITTDVPKLHRRVIFPSFDQEGHLNFYTARSVDRGIRQKYWVPSSDRVGVIFNECNIDWKRELTVVEGPFDLTKCDDNATCLLGSGLSEDYHLFWRIVENNTPVLLALDSDAQKKMHRFAKLLASYNIAVRVLDLGTFADVGEMSRSEFLRRKNDARVWNGWASLKFQIQQLARPSGSLSTLD